MAEHSGEGVTSNDVVKKMPSPITLKPPGQREVVDEERAGEFIEGWKAELQTQKKLVLAAVGGDTEKAEEAVLCDKIILSDKSYTAAAAVRIASFLTRGDPSVASKVVVADLSDVIASRMEEEGLQVLQILCDAFQEADLVEVDLSDNAMGSKGVSACRSVLSGQSGSLERLSLCNNGLSEASMNEIADILTGGVEGGADHASDSATICSRLTKIHFFNNMSGPGGCDAFSRVLSRCTESLKDLRFSGTRAGSDGSLLIASSLDSMGDKLRNLERLDLADNSFGTEGAPALSKALARCHKLLHLNLRDCMLEDDGVEDVCHAIFGSDAALELLDLSGNEMARKGAKSLAEVIEETSSIKVLHAEDNELTSLGVKEIAKMISSIGEGDEKIESTIEELRLGCNECGRIGAQALINAYGLKGEKMPNLKAIHLNGNKFPDETVDALRAVFGSKLGLMDENDDDEDPDEDLEDDEDDGIEDDDDDDKNDADVNELAKSIAGTHIDGLC